MAKRKTPEQLRKEIECLKKKEKQKEKQIQKALGEKRERARLEAELYELKFGRLRKTGKKIMSVIGQIGEDYQKNTERDRKEWERRMKERGY